MRYYEFQTIWRFDAPVAEVWDAVKASESWPQWWKGVISVEEIRSGNPDGLGSVRRSVWKSALPYTLEFDSEVVNIEHHKLIEARAFGDLQGRGLWNFESESEELTRVTYDWRVATHKPWMNLIAPLAKPFFKWNHDIIMKWGGEGLANRLGCKLL